MTTGKTIALTRGTFVSKVMSLLFNMLYRLIITFLPRSKCLLISWQLSPSAVISESHSVVSESLQSHGLYSPWNSPDQNIGVGSLSLLQGIFPTQGLNSGLPHCRQILHQLSHKGQAAWPKKKKEIFFCLTLCRQFLKPIWNISLVSNYIIYQNKSNKKKIKIW